MGDDIGLLSMSICFDFQSTNVVHLSNRNPYFYWFQYDIGLGLLSMSVCFHFRSTNVVQLSNRNLYFYRFSMSSPINNPAYFWGQESNGSRFLLKNQFEAIVWL